MIAPRLHAISDVTIAGSPDVVAERFEKLASLARPGSVAVQLRDHELTARVRLALGQRLREICRRHGAPLIVNDRLDLALALAADGVHLGERSVRPVDARKLLPQAWISRACHAPDRVAEEPDADAVMLSPIIAGRKARSAFGLEALRRARALLPSRVSLIALGGVDSESAASCLEAGADAVAVIGAVLGTKDDRGLEALLEALEIRRA